MTLPIPRQSNRLVWNFDWITWFQPEMMSSKWSLLFCTDLITIILTVKAAVLSPCTFFLHMYECCCFLWPTVQENIKKIRGSVSLHVKNRYEFGRTQIPKDKSTLHGSRYPSKIQVCLILDRHFLQVAAGAFRKEQLAASDFSMSHSVSSMHCREETDLPFSGGHKHELLQVLIELPPDPCELLRRWMEHTASAVGRSGRKWRLLTQRRCTCGWCCFF